MIRPRFHFGAEALFLRVVFRFSTSFLAEQLPNTNLDKNDEKVGVLIIILYLYAK